MLETLRTGLLNDGRPFTRQQAADLGLGHRPLQTAIRDGTVRRVLQSVYVDRAVPDSRTLRCRCLQLVMPRDGVLFGTSACWVLGVDAFQPSERFVLTPICLVPHGSGRSRRSGVRTVEGKLPAGDLIELDGLRLTVPDRTAVDLLRRLRRPFALSAVDAMAHAGLIVPAAVQERVDRMRKYSGIVQARQLVRWIEPLTESRGESWQRLRLIDAGFPHPVAQFWVCDRQGRRLYRLDLAYPHLLIACEYDGREDHTAAEDISADDSRRADLKSRWGWRLVVCQQPDIFGSDPWFEVEVGKLLDRDPILPRLW